MHRPRRPDDPKLEALLDQRDHVRIQISLAHDASPTDEDGLRALRLELSELESRLRLYQ